MGLMRSSSSMVCTRCRARSSRMRTSRVLVRTPRESYLGGGEGGRLGSFSRAAASATTCHAKQSVSQSVSQSHSSIDSFHYSQ
jgi:hypothetical protein